MAKRNESITHTEYTNAFKRQKSIPLDSSSVFYGTSSKLKEDYSSKDTSGAYVGQIVSVVNPIANKSDTDAYIILNEQGNLDKITLNSELNAEKSTRASADATLQTNINNEASLRSAADATLQTNIETVEGLTISTITRNSNTFTVTRKNGDTFTFTQKDDNATYKAASPVSLNGDTFGIVTNPEFSGTVKASGFNASSDERLKENFEPFYAEKSILDLPVYRFDFIEGAKNQIGCKAQDLQKICPELVEEDSKGYLGIQESKIVYLLLEEVKKLRKEVNELKGK